MNNFGSTIHEQGKVIAAFRETFEKICFSETNYLYLAEFLSWDYIIDVIYVKKELTLKAAEFHFTRYSFPRGGAIGVDFDGFCKLMYSIETPAVNSCLENDDCLLVTDKQSHSQSKSFDGYGHGLDKAYVNEHANAWTWTRKASDI